MNHHAVHALYSRLVDDRVDVLLLDDEESDAAPGPLKETALREAVQGSDVVLICLSKEMMEAGRSAEVKLVSDMMMEKPQGELFVTPVRFEPCDLPDSMKRWQVVNLFEEDGYGKLMMALKLRADRRGAVLEPRESWRDPLQLGCEKVACF